MRGNLGIIPLTEYLEYFRKRQDRKSMKLKAGDGDRTRDVQLGNMDAVCLSKTSLFNTFRQVYGIAPEGAKWPVFVS